MKSSDLDTITTHDLSCLGTVIHAQALGDTVEVWLDVPRAGEHQHLIRRIACHSPEQAQSIARLWKALYL